MDDWLIKNASKGLTSNNQFEDQRGAVMTESTSDKNICQDMGMKAEGGKRTLLKKRKHKGKGKIKVKKMSDFFPKKVTVTKDAAEELEAGESDHKDKENVNPLQTNLACFFEKESPDEQKPRRRTTFPRSDRCLPLLLFKRELHGRPDALGRKALLRKSLGHLQCSPVIMGEATAGPVHETQQTYISSLKFDPMEVLLAATSIDGTVLIYDFDEFLFRNQKRAYQVKEPAPPQESMRPVLRFETKKEIADLQWNPQNLNQIAVSFKHWHAICIFDLEEMSETGLYGPKKVLQVQTGLRRGRAPSAAYGNGYSAILFKAIRGRMKVVAGGTRGLLRLWDLEAPDTCAWEVMGATVKSMDTGRGSLGHSSYPTSAILDYGKDRILVVTVQMAVQVWDVVNLTTSAFGQRPGPQCVRSWDLSQSVCAPGRTLPLLGIVSVSRTGYKHEFAFHLKCGTVILFDATTGTIAATSNIISDERGLKSSCWISQHSMACQTNSSSSEIKFHDFSNTCPAIHSINGNPRSRRPLVRKKAKGFDFCLPLRIVHVDKGNQKITFDKDPSSYLSPTLVSKANEIMIMGQLFKVKQCEGNSITVEPPLSFGTSIPAWGNTTILTNFEVFSEKGDNAILFQNRQVHHISSTMAGITCVHFHNGSGSVICGLMKKNICVLMSTPSPNCQT